MLIVSQHPNGGSALSEDPNKASEHWWGYSFESPPLEDNTYYC